MIGGRTFGWCLLLVWAAWLFALQGWLASSDGVGAWTPELGIVLLLALGSKLRGADAFLALFLVSGARMAFSTDPPLAILAGYGFLALVARWLERFVEIDRPVARAALAAFAAYVLGSYWSATRSLAIAADGILAVPPEASAAPPFAGIVATAACAVALGPLLLRLPGTSLLWRRRS